MNKLHTPITIADAIRKMSIEEMAFLSPDYAYVQERSRQYASKRCKCSMWKMQDLMEEYMSKFLSMYYIEQESLVNLGDGIND